MTTAQKLRDLRAELVQRFPERQSVIDGSLAAVLASEHVLFIGPPGTAKSALCRALASAFGGRYFERLLTKFSTPDEIYGPVSLKALEQDRFERVVEGTLPEAEFAFLDEVFRANSSILNSLLTLMNERIFHNGTRNVLGCPLYTLFGASNELPEGRELEAVFDRFLLRFDVQYLVQLTNLREVLLAPEPVSSVRMTIDELVQAQAAVAAVDVTDKTMDGMMSIREALQSEGIVASDRRWKKSLKLVRASAYMSGESKTAVEDLSVLVDSLWREPKERSKVARIVGTQADPVSAQANEVLESAREIAANLVTLKKGEPDKYVGATAKAISTYVEQKNRLIELQRQGGKRSKTTVADAITEVQGLHAEAKRAVSKAMNLGPTLSEIAGI